jgi:heat-inducible transcriptional repressor
MKDLTQRQIDILTAIVTEHSHSGQAVGSEILEKKYKLGVSPATIRNEMVALEKKGYLQKNHFSSGRVPSAMGFRFYITQVMKEKELSTVDEVAYKHSIWDDRQKEHRLLSQAARVLASRTGLLSLVATSSGDLYYAGIGNILQNSELLEPEFSSQLLHRLDEINFWEEIVRKTLILNEDLLYILGEEDFRDPVFERCASIFGDFETLSSKGIIGILGPKHMRYDAIAPQIRFFSHLIEEIIKEHTEK